MCRETEEAGLGRRGGPAGWNPLPAGGAVAERKGQVQVRPNPPPLTLAVAYPTLLCPHSCLQQCFLHPATKATMLCLAQNMPRSPLNSCWSRPRSHILYSEAPSLISLTSRRSSRPDAALDGALSAFTPVPWNSLLPHSSSSLARVSRFPSHNRSSWKAVISPSPDPGYCTPFPDLSRKLGSRDQALHCLAKCWPGKSTAQDLVFLAIKALTDICHSEPNW